ncbi:hypothetical protein SAMN05421676_12122 [Salinibacillus kushneri]|uniref:Uncharacterized protein n=1 Tax=Salinibacillus kushneri TaxID=237682 RepID=A0A1I0JIC9_9BACI|nr:hypothetical protein [Salinibacillus kushneri]SEU10025.1 hypothetical protein SAMN05421676_12122 [Salinibacillus kushneri]
MKLNRSGTPSVSYFKSYMLLIMNTRTCSLEVAKEVAYENLFERDSKRLGEQAFRNFQQAHKELMTIYP